MSLINDALKRAKEAQRNHPAPAPELQFRPAEPHQRPSTGSPSLLIVAAIVVFGLIGLLAALVLHKRAAARPADLAQSVVPVASVPPEEIVPMLQPALEVPPGVETSETSNASAPTPSAPEETAATDAVPNAALTVAEAPEPPPLPKLQGIFYRPDRPSAVVNGKNVFIGNRVGDFQVLAISHEGVTIGSGTQTNVLTLE